METLQKFLISPSKATVLLIHGAGEHIGRYQHVGEWLNQHGISMIGGDLPGLGRSKETRGHISDFNQYLEKVDQWLDFVKKEYPDQPIFLFGHSMGGLIVLRYLQERAEELSGVIVTSPAIRLGMKIPAWQVKLAEIMVKIWPTLRLKSGIKAEQLTHDEAIVKANQVDPLVQGKVTIQWFFEFQKSIQEFWAEVDFLKDLDFRLLYLQAGEDALVDPQASKDFVREMQSDKIDFHFLPGLYHEVLNEVDREKYLKMIVDWIEKQVKS